MLEKELVFPWLYNCLYKNFHSFHKVVLPHEASSASKGKNKNFLMYIFSLGLNTPYNKIWMRKFEWYRRKLCLYFLGKTGFQDLKCPGIIFFED